MLAAILLAATLDPAAAATAIAEPPAGKLYHGVFPGGRDGMGGDISPSDVLGYQQLVGKRPTWIYFCSSLSRTSSAAALTRTFAAGCGTPGASGPRCWPSTASR
jgi:hypothetical protein